MTEQLLVHIDRVARESASPIGIPIEISSMMVFTAKTTSVKTSGVKRAAVSIALRENRRRRSERQRNRDYDANFGAHCPSPLFAVSSKETGRDGRIFLPIAGSRNSSHISEVFVIAPRRSERQRALQSTVHHQIEIAGEWASVLSLWSPPQPSRAPSLVETGTGVDELLHRTDRFSSELLTSRPDPFLTHGAATPSGAGERRHFQPFTSTFPAFEIAHFDMRLNTGRASPARTFGSCRALRADVGGIRMPLGSPSS